MEPFIIVILACLIGGIVVSMYLPIFKLGQWCDLQMEGLRLPLLLSPVSPARLASAAS
jgi:hypothetical protein